MIRAEPDWGKLPANFHWRLREVLERCLKKEAKDRYHDISDVKVDIQRVLTDPSGVLVQRVAAVEPRRKLRTILTWAAVTLVLGLIIGGVAVWKLKPPEPRQVTRFSYEVPEGQQLNDQRPLLAISPDGRLFVYSTTNGLYLRSVDAMDAKLIAGTEGDTMRPFFSPDGRWIGYYSLADRKLKKIAINSGAPVTVCDLTGFFFGASWNADDTIVYGTPEGGILRISANGGNLTLAPVVNARTPSQH